MADKDKKIEVKPYKNGGGAKIDIYSPDPKNDPHDSIHIKINTEDGTFKTITKIDGKKETSSGGCYLTSACMKHMQENFDDNCEELTILRWFRDNFVSEEDMNHYYNTAPIIVEAIDELKDNDSIYNYIYNNIVNACVVAIKNGNYEFAYNRYKNSILVLEEQFAKPKLKNRFVKTLKLRNQNL